MHGVRRELSNPFRDLIPRKGSIRRVLDYWGILSGRDCWNNISQASDEIQNYPLERSVPSLEIMDFMSGNTSGRIKYLNTSL